MDRCVLVLIHLVLFYLSSVRSEDMCFDVSCGLRWIDVFSFLLQSDRTFWFDLDDRTKINLVKIYLGVARSEFCMIWCDSLWVEVVGFMCLGQDHLV